MIMEGNMFSVEENLNISSWTAGLWPAEGSSGWSAELGRPSSLAECSLAPSEPSSRDQQISALDYGSWSGEYTHSDSTLLAVGSGQ